MTTDETKKSFADAKILSDQVMRHATDAVAPMLAQLTQLQHARADRLAAAADRLKTTLGADHPRVQALTRATASVRAFEQVLDVEAVRAARRPKVEANEWLVFGRVFDLLGNPAPGLHVRVFDRDRKYDDLLGDTTTDEYGDFAVKYHERDFAEVGEALSELYVLVSDAAGKVLFSSRDNVRYESGRSEYFEIALERTPESTPTKPKTTPSKAKRSARKRAAE